MDQSVHRPLQKSLLKNFSLMTHNGEIGEIFLLPKISAYMAKLCIHFDPACTVQCIMFLLTKYYMYNEAPYIYTYKLYLYAYVSVS